MPKKYNCRFWYTIIAKILVAILLFIVPLSSYASSPPISTIGSGEGYTAACGVDSSGNPITASEIEQSYQQGPTDITNMTSLSTCNVYGSTAICPLTAQNCQLTPCQSPYTLTATTSSGVGTCSVTATTTTTCPTTSSGITGTYNSSTGQCQYTPQTTTSSGTCPNPFTNCTVPQPITPNQIEQEVIWFYQAYAGRPADPGGLQYWVNWITNNCNGQLPISTLTPGVGNTVNCQGFINAFTNTLISNGETNNGLSIFGNSSNQQALNIAYQNLFNRDPSYTNNDGTYWLNQLNSGALSLTNLPIAMLGGAGGTDVNSEENKISSNINLSLAISPNLTQADETVSNFNFTESNVVQSVETEEETPGLNTTPSVITYCQALYWLQSSALAVCGSDPICSVNVSLSGSSCIVTPVTSTTSASCESPYTPSNGVCVADAITSQTCPSAGNNSVQLSNGQCSYNVYYSCPIPGQNSNPCVFSNGSTAANNQSSTNIQSYPQDNTNSTTACLTTQPSTCPDNGTPNSSGVCVQPTNYNGACQSIMPNSTYNASIGECVVSGNPGTCPTMNGQSVTPNNQGVCQTAIINNCSTLYPGSTYNLGQCVEAPTTCPSGGTPNSSGTCVLNEGSACPSGTTQIGNTCYSCPSGSNLQNIGGTEYCVYNTVSNSACSGCLTSSGKCIVLPTSVSMNPPSCPSPGSGSGSLYDLFTTNFSCINNPNNTPYFCFDNNYYCEYIYSNTFYSYQLPQWLCYYANGSTCPSSCQSPYTIQNVYINSQSQCACVDYIWTDNITCPSGYSPDSGGLYCQNNNVCSSGNFYTYNGTNYCVATPTTSPAQACPTNYTPNSTGTQCLGPNVCPSGMNYNSAQNLCIGTIAPSLSCSSPYTPNASGTYCVGPTVCPSNTYYNPTIKACTFTGGTPCTEPYKGESVCPGNYLYVNGQCMSQGCFNQQPPPAQSTGTSTSGSGSSTGCNTVTFNTPAINSPVIDNECNTLTQANSQNLTSNLISTINIGDVCMADVANVAYSPAQCQNIVFTGVGNLIKATCIEQGPGAYAGSSSGTQVNTKTEEVGTIRLINCYAAGSIVLGPNCNSPIMTYQNQTLTMSCSGSSATGQITFNKTPPPQTATTPTPVNSAMININNINFTTDQFGNQVPVCSTQCYDTSTAVNNPATPDGEAGNATASQNSINNCLGSIFIFNGSKNTCLERHDGMATGCCDKDTGTLQDSKGGVGDIGMLTEVAGTLQKGYDIIKSGAMAYQMYNAATQVQTLAGSGNTASMLANGYDLNTDQTITTLSNGITGTAQQVVAQGANSVTTIGDTVYVTNVPDAPLLENTFGNVSGQASYASYNLAVDSSVQQVSSTTMSATTANAAMSGVNGATSAGQAATSAVENYVSQMGPQLAQAGANLVISSMIQDPAEAAAASFAVDLGIQLATSFNPVTLGLDLYNLANALFLYQCSASDVTTDTMNHSNYCVHVGDYCTESLLGWCLDRVQSYCCFDSELALIIQEQARPQFSSATDDIGCGETFQANNLTTNFNSPPWSSYLTNASQNTSPTPPGYPVNACFGSAKHPNCRGFTPDELQLIDFSKINFGPYVQFLEENVQSDVNANIQSLQNNMQSVIQQMQQKEQSYINSGGGVQ